MCRASVETATTNYEVFGIWRFDNEHAARFQCPHDLFEQPDQSLKRQVLNEVKGRYCIQTVGRQTLQVNQSVCFDHVETGTETFFDKHPVAIDAPGFDPFRGE